MGHSLSFQALPEESRLFARLHREPKIGTLVAQLFNCGGGAYTWASLEDLDEILQGLTEDMPGLFTSRAEVDQTMADLIVELEEVRAEHPGLERRRAYLEKTQWDIEEQLTRKLDRGDLTEPDPLIQAILFGEQMLTPAGVRGPLGDGLRWVGRTSVALAAGMLRKIAPGSLFDKEAEDWLYDDYRSWRRMYLAAADHREAVIVGD